MKQKRVQIFSPLSLVGRKRQQKNSFARQRLSLKQSGDKWIKIFTTSVHTVIVLTTTCEVCSYAHVRMCQYSLTSCVQIACMTRRFFFSPSPLSISERKIQCIVTQLAKGVGKNSSKYGRKERTRVVKMPFKLPNKGEMKKSFSLSLLPRL